MEEVRVSYEEFCEAFKFKKHLHTKIGVEDEVYLIDNKSRKIVSRADKALQFLGNRKYSYEPSNCQLEYKTDPCSEEKVISGLSYERDVLRSALAGINLDFVHLPWAPPDIPMDLYPDPTGRYQRITKNKSKEFMETIFRVASTQINVGMRDHSTALEVYNLLVSKYYTKLMNMAFDKCPERIDAYGILFSELNPPVFSSWREVYDWHRKRDFLGDNLGNNWSFIRLSKHGCIEIRMFGAIADLDYLRDLLSVIMTWCRGK